jgi:3-hydroxyisobutyrate dehydrogenase-like beta-hydroxyacid dehydrogenase
MSDRLLGFVGVGRMGGPMANRLLDAGHRLCIYDLSEEATKPLVARGAELAGSPAEVASKAEIVLISLPTPDVVRQVALGSNAGIVNGSKVRLLVDLSSAASAGSTRR